MVNVLKAQIKELVEAWLSDQKSDHNLYYYYLYPEISKKYGMDINIVDYPIGKIVGDIIKEDHQLVAKIILDFKYNLLDIKFFL